MLQIFLPPASAFFVIINMLREYRINYNPFFIFILIDGQAKINPPRTAVDRGVRNLC